jgi:hypothetical protein
MQRRDTFSRDEFATIRRLVGELRLAEATRQKSIRARRTIRIVD